ncbi:hypothetical protein [Polyangium aurulentum]|uniref:hypothetical protein n=1 Tax=Polyangium aurulentum TaxID=2567896 RepID=UPI0010AE5FA9|nr:hypothetical protein [Polyangium aurulentum]UQA62680.1 hypothetical protein E8A73_020380 [Polyangium aurulentum]
MRARTTRVGRTSILGGAVALGMMLAAAGPAWAQATPEAASEPLPFTTTRVVASGAFGQGWARVVSDTVEVLEALANLSRHGAPNMVAYPGQATEATQLWGPDTRIFIPPGPEQPTVRVGPATATLMPIELASSIVAEARGQQAVLVGLQIRLPWQVP